MGYLDDVYPYASYASQRLGIPVEVILAQWQIETGGGTSRASRLLNNQAGIMRPGGEQAGLKAYLSLDDFTNDYIRVMSLPYYDRVRTLGQAGADPGSVALALGESPWDGGNYQKYGIKGGALLAVLNSIKKGAQYLPPPIGNLPGLVDSAKKAKDAITGTWDAIAEKILWLFSEQFVLLLAGLVIGYLAVKTLFAR